MHTSKPFSILRPVAGCRPDVDPADIVGTTHSPQDLLDLLVGLDTSDVLAIDLETQGVSVASPETRIVGVGLAWRCGDDIQAKYFNYANLDDTSRHILWQRVSTARTSIAHNLLFDGAHVWREATRLGVPEPQWAYCTFGLYKQLAGESFPQQSWSLKGAQVDLLGWAETNEGGIDSWLVDHGYITDGPTSAADETREEYAARVRQLVTEGRTYRPDKGEMWRVPPDILGAYCILDCLSTLQLFDDVLWPALEQFPELDEFHREVFVPMDRLLWTQQFSGIRVSVERLGIHRLFLAEKMAEAEAQMRSGPMAQGIRELEASLMEELLSREPPQFKKRKLGAEPPATKKDGTPSKNWEKWAARRDSPPEVRGDWVAWDIKRRRAAAGELPEYRFNPASVAHLSQLLYGGTAPLVVAEATPRTMYKKGKQIPVFSIHGIHGPVDIPGTDGGELPVNADLFSQLPPDLGAPLRLYADAEQELGYVVAYLAAAQPGPGGHRVHPGWINPGTKTGRLAGSKPNLQQIPKTVQFMECLVADEGTTWVEMDWSALEPHVLAELSQDPALLGLYGEGAKKHDVYLYSGAHYAVLGDEIRPHYDIHNPDVPTAKAKLKRVREACKVVVLAKSYGAGAKKIWAGLRLAGFPITEVQAKQISDSHDEMYAASGGKFHEVLLREWTQRGGWVLSGLGHPVAVWEGATKDLINRVVQKTGHDIHMLFAVDVSRRLGEAGIPAAGVVWDFHDQLIFQVASEHGPRATDILREAVAALNQRLGGTVKLKGEPKLCTNMAEAKEAEFSWTK